MKGLELIHNIISRTLNSRDDAILAVIHCLLINNDCLCVGRGDTWDVTDVTSGSELLPDNWNEDAERNGYALRYVTKDQARYLLKVIRAEGLLLVNLVNVQTGKIIGSSLKSEDFVNDDWRNFKTTYKKLGALKKKLKNDILVGAGINTKDAQPPRRSSSPQQAPEDPDPLRVSGPSHRSRTDPDSFYFSDPFEYGRSDLDPLGGVQGPGTGGMIFRPVRPRLDPYSGPRAPARGSIPPGARYDPPYPLLPGQPPRPRGPDPDSFRTPPDYDDMFG